MAPEDGFKSDIVGALELNRASHRVSWNGEEIPLTVGEFRIVDLLANRAGEDVGYREIYDVVRGQGFVAGQGPDGYRQNVRTFVKRIRQKFRGSDPTFGAIENCPGIGYRWRRGDVAMASGGLAAELRLPLAE